MPKPHKEQGRASDRGWGYRPRVDRGAAAPGQDVGGEFGMGRLTGLGERTRTVTAQPLVSAEN